VFGKSAWDMSINWDADASLQKDTLRERVPGQYEIAARTEVWHGTLSGAVREWLAQPHNQKPLYTILTGAEADAPAWTG
jgi:hypothetical protein